jgi:hypothetical protein
MKRSKKLQVENTVGDGSFRLAGLAFQVKITTESTPDGLIGH